MGEELQRKREHVESVTTMLVKEIAEKEGVEPIELSPPLNTVVDLDALEALFFDGKGRFARVEFTYSGYQITIEGADGVHIEIT